VNGNAPEYLDRPLYSFAEADHLAGAARGTARRWLLGYSYVRQGQRIEQPRVTPGIDSTRGVSFLDLVEVVAIRRLHSEGFSLREIRSIVTNCQGILGLERPLVRAKFKAGGKDIFVSLDRGTLVEVGRRKRMTAWTDILEPFLKELDYWRDDWANKWWPLGHDRRIVIDPEYGFGLPVIAGSGVRTEIIWERIRAGDLPEEIAEDFNVSPLEVDRAIQFEASRAA
jgi:uncharacterized protein (DUF433 family)